MKVRATQDGTYAGYYRIGPTEDGQFPGEVFEIDEKPFEVRDPATNKAVLELDENGAKIKLLDEKGKPRFDSKGNPLYKIKMASWFSPKWMVVVDENTPTTFDYPPFELPVMFRAKKVQASNTPLGNMTVHAPDTVASVI